MKAGSARYASGENKTRESAADTSFRSTDCYRSTDLSHGSCQGAALSRQSAGDPGVLVDLGSGGVAHVPEESTAPGTALQQWAATGGTNQIRKLNRTTQALARRPYQPGPAAESATSPAPRSPPSAAERGERAGPIR
ncbi:hypothetical protein [Streptomyces sp. NPDC048332]|uniref:RICIN domain-containing protein n=1 Tax=Streptomyces sp. NPDC048332 TaxID=3154619 RepID=UPI0034336340